MQIAENSVKIVSITSMSGIILTQKQQQVALSLKEMRLQQLLHSAMNVEQERIISGND